MPQRATWKKPEKLKSRKRIERVFREGKSFSIFPYKVVFLVAPADGDPAVQADRPVVGRRASGAAGVGKRGAGGPIEGEPIEDRSIESGLIGSGRIEDGSIESGLIGGGRIEDGSIGGGLGSGKPITGSGPAEEMGVPDKLVSGGGRGAEATGSGNPAKSRTAAVQAGFGAASRNFKKAVDRNRIKRLSREAYRLQKGPLLEQLAHKGLTMAVFFVFIGKELPDYPTVSAKIGVALQKLLRETA